MKKSTTIMKYQSSVPVAKPTMDWKLLAALSGNSRVKQALVTQRHRLPPRPGTAPVADLYIRPFEPELVGPDDADQSQGDGRVLAMECQQARRQIEFAVAPGEMVAFDNRRVLHGRGAFDPRTGRRHLQGSYLDRDMPESRLRVLARQP